MALDQSVIHVYSYLPANDLTPWKAIGGLSQGYFVKNGKLCLAPLTLS